MNSLAKTLSTRPMLPALSAGLATFVLMMLLAWAGVAVETREDLRRETGRLLNTWVDSIEHGERLYSQLENLAENDCGPVHLSKLNTLVYINSPITNIWYFPDGGTVAGCSASFGRFDPPHDFGPHHFTDASGRQTWYLASFGRVEGIEAVTLLKKNRYAVSIYRTGRLAMSSAGLLYAPQPDNPLAAAYKIEGTGALIEQSLGGFGPVLGPVFARACSDGATRLCYLTRIDPAQVLQDNALLLTIFAVFSTMIGLLVSLRVRRHMQLRNSARGRIRRAIRLGGRGFVPHYQPILTLETMRCEGCEVLARFEDAQGRLYPDEFIPIIQDMGLTWAFTEIIIARALEDLTPLLSGRPGFKVSVNFFQADLEDDQIQTVIQSPVFRAATDAGILLCCEILETGIGNGTSIAKSLRYLRGIGCLIAIDDFGTGYSNLAQIKALDPDLIKIDKMFVDDLSNASATARGVFVQAILGIAEAHDMEVCAEGVETLEQLASLTRVKVDYAQGYYFARPMPIRDFSLYLLEQSLKEKLPRTGKLPRLSGSATG